MTNLPGPVIRRVPYSVEVELLNSRIDTLEADNARLREAIRSEAEQHDIDGRDGLPRAYPCDCQICQIAREGR